MAIRYAVATGNWSSTSTWDGGTLPTSSDDVYADGKTVTIDQSITVISLNNGLRSGGTIGGTFNVTSGGLTINARLDGGYSSTVLMTISAASGTITINGNINSYATSTYNSSTLNITGAATINVNGNVTASATTASAARAIYYTANGGTLNIVGDVTGNLSDSALGFATGVGASSFINVTGTITTTGTNHAVRLTTSYGTLSVTGTITNNSTNSGYSIYLTGLGTVNVTGTVTAVYTQPGIYLGSNAAVNVVGDVVGSSTSTGNGITNASTGTISVTGAAIGANAAAIAVSAAGTTTVSRARGNDWGLGSTGLTQGAVGVANSQNGVLYVKTLEFGARGYPPVSGPMAILDDTNSVIKLRNDTFTEYTFVRADSTSFDTPSPSDVRSGVSYAQGTKTGTLAMPSASTVRYGVVYDNGTVGASYPSAADIWNYPVTSMTTAGSIGERLKNIATTDQVGQIVAAFSRDTIAENNYQQQATYQKLNLSGQ